MAYPYNNNYLNQYQLPALSTAPYINWGNGAQRSMALGQTRAMIGSSFSFTNGIGIIIPIFGAIFVSSDLKNEQYLQKEFNKHGYLIGTYTNNGFFELVKLDIGQLSLVNI